MLPNAAPDELGWQLTRGWPQTVSNGLLPLAKPYWFVPGDGTVGYFDGGGFSYFPTDPPPGYDFVNAHFYPTFANAPEDDYDYIEVEWFTVDAFGSDILGNIATSIQQQFQAQGQGFPLAIRLYKKQIFNVEVPSTYCLPSFLPFGVGGCHNVPLVGGQTVASGWQYRLQMLYHNVIAVVVAVTIAIVALIGFALLFDEVTHDTYHITTSLLDAIKNSTPGGAASAVSGTFILMAVAFGIAAYVLPTISQPSVGTAIRAGPATVSVGSGGRAGGRPR